MSENLIYWAWLTLAYGPANPAKWNAISYCGSPKALYSRVFNPDSSYTNIPEFNKICKVPLSKAKALIEFCNENCINLCSFDDDNYPDNLREIYNPPSLLFVRGDLSCLKDSFIITCVGTKNPSTYSQRVSSKIVSDLVYNSAVTVSSSSRGLDELVHKTSIANGGKTVVILPCGILNGYRSLDNEFTSSIEANGAIISEFLPSEAPTANNYRARNRLLSGISHGTVVLQAGFKSGALSTASYAISQGRELFCIPPHELFSNEYSGVAKLIRDGAVCVFDSSDILNEYLSSYQSIPKNMIIEVSGEEPFEADNTEPKAEVDFLLLRGNSLSVAQFIADKGSALYDEIADNFGNLISEELEAILTDLELDGYIKPLPGNRFTV